MTLEKTRPKSEIVCCWNFLYNIQTKKHLSFPLPLPLSPFLPDFQTKQCYFILPLSLSFFTSSFLLFSQIFFLSFSVIFARKILNRTRPPKTYSRIIELQFDCVKRLKHEYNDKNGRKVLKRKNEREGGGRERENGGREKYNGKTWRKNETSPILMFMIA